MITAAELFGPQRAGRMARNLRAKQLAFMGRNGANNANFRALVEKSVRDERLQLSGMGEGETTSDAAPVAAPAASGSSSTPSWLKWAGVAIVAGIALYALKRRS